MRSRNQGWVWVAESTAHHPERGARSDARAATLAEGDRMETACGSDRTHTCRTQLDLALERIAAETEKIDPEAAIARFNSAW